MAQCEWAMLVRLQLCWASFVYDYSEGETNMSNITMKIHFHSTNCLTCNQFLESQIETCYLRNLLNCAFFIIVLIAMIASSRPYMHLKYLGQLSHTFLTIGFENVIFYFCAVSGKNNYKLYGNVLVHILQ